MQNEGGTGYDGWEIDVPGKEDQAYYYRRLASAEKKRGYETGWSLTVRATPEDGMAFTGVEFGPGYRRFDIWFHRDSDSRVMIGLPVQISPDILFFGTYTLEAGVRADTEVQLRFDSVTKLADLYVDGQKRLSGYAGWDQYNREDRGLFFGAFDYPRGHKGRAVYRKVEFRSN